MYGFTIIQSKEVLKEELLLKTKKNFFFSSGNNVNYFFGYSYFSKFFNDKIFEENNQYIIGIDGVIFNLQELKNDYSTSNYFELVIKLFEKNKIDFISSLKGEFNGFIFRKKTEELFFFNNKTGTKQIFYTSINNYNIISQSLESIVFYKTDKNSSNSLNEIAFYDMLSFGATLENRTLIKDVFRLQAGKYLTLNNFSFQEKEYHTYNTVQASKLSKNTLLKEIDVAFKNALKLEYEKDKEYNFSHFALLSGGLDSRMSVLLGKKMGYVNSTLCFSIPNYLDEKISKSIADAYKLNHKFISLDEGNYMLDLEENFSINNGICFYTGSAHYNFALKQVDLKNFGLIHSGQIGDGVLGSLLSKNNDYCSKAISKLFLEKSGIDKNYLNTYKTEEVFKLYQNVFNRTHTGSFTTEHHKTYLVSPFLDDDFISLCLSISPSLKRNQNIYLEWIKNFHPETTNFVWERTGFKPNKKWKTNLSKYTNKLKNEFYKLNKQLHKNSMAPEDFWVVNNRKVKDYYVNFFNQNIHSLYNNKELYKDLKTYYQNGKSTEKAIVLTILQAIKMYNLKV